MISSMRASKNPVNNIFIIAGEESGDLHGSHLVRELLKTYPQLKFIGHGGDKMAAAGVEIIEHISALSLIGFTEVLKHLPYMFSVMNNTIETIRKIQPIRVILIDYPGFNLKLAQRLKKLSIPITYFILPQAWAWKEKRTNKIHDYIDQALSIIPFEKDWYKQRGINIDFVGHPFVDLEKPPITKNSFFSKHTLALNTPLLAILPGSRQQEINRHWPILNHVINKLHNIFPNIQFIVGQAPDVILPTLPKYVRIEKDNPRLTMYYGDAGLIASGTATLEAAVLNLPTVVFYKTSKITYWIGKRLTKVKYLSLTNLIANRQIVPEFIQHKMTVDALVKAIIPLLSDTPERKKTVTNYKQITEQLGEHGVYRRAAKLIAERSF
ncbi:MAG: lipid-A-disaccharide synthase [Planctomycetia bacterium]|nr:lipid-A-disaccharide synthase [Planctomycetia bacterium]